MPHPSLISLTTSGVKISVETFYQEEYSRPMEQKYVYAYRITIENINLGAVRLLRRHWYIRETGGLLKEVEGEGVIGSQPVIQPGDSFQYVSWTHVTADLGAMYGYYTMAHAESGETFQAKIPAFDLIPPYKLN